MIPIIKFIKYYFTFGDVLRDPDGLGATGGLFGCGGAALGYY